MTLIPEIETETPLLPAYPSDTEGLVSVLFTDGEVKIYPISANASVSTYLTQQMGSTGVLNLWTRGRSVMIPREQIREISIEDYGDPKPKRGRGGHQ